MTVLCRDALGIPSVIAAMIGLSILLLLGVLDWDDCLSEKSAWDTLAWFAVLVGMAGQLTNLGIVTWMSDCVAKSLQSFSLGWPAAFGVLQASYFLIHYLFASQTGHVGALYSAFLAMHLAAGVPGVLAALALAYNTNLFGALTHYSSGQAAVYYGGMCDSVLCNMQGLMLGLIAYRNKVMLFFTSFDQFYRVPSDIFRSHRCSWLYRSSRCVQNGICDGPYQCPHLGSSWNLLVEILGSLLTN